VPLLDVPHQFLEAFLDRREILDQLRGLLAHEFEPFVQSGARISGFKEKFVKTVNRSRKYLLITKLSSRREINYQA
jgi:hypothetical protein